MEWQYIFDFPMRETFFSGRRGFQVKLNFPPELAERLIGIQLRFREPDETQYQHKEEYEKNI